MYRYIQIGSDEGFSQTLPEARIINEIKVIPSCVTDERHGFKNTPDIPWFRLNIAQCDAQGNYVTNRLPDNDDNTANMVELICEDKGNDVSRAFYKSLAGIIAESLGWVVIHEIDD